VSQLFARTAKKLFVPPKVLFIPPKTPPHSGVGNFQSSRSRLAA
jgi:hypothetical protein